VFAIYIYLQRIVFKLSMYPINFIVQKNKRDIYIGSNPRFIANFARDSQDTYDVF
jgi:hypothetical protein